MEPILRKAISCTFCVVSMGLKKPLGCNALRSAKRSQKPYIPYPCLQPFGISSGYYSFLRLNQPWHPSLPHALPQCLITSTQFCPSTMESVSLSFYNQANFHPTRLRTSCAPPFFISTKASSEMPGHALLCEHSSQKKAKYLFFLSVNLLVTTLMKSSFKDPQHQKSYL